MHPASGVNEHDIVMLVLGIEESLLRDHSRIILVALFVQGNVEAGSMSCELLDCTATEIVTASKHDFEIALCLEIMGSFSQAS